MNYAMALVRFWYDFIIGDDWRIAVAVVVTIGVVGLLAYDGINAWWLLPVAVFAMLNLSLWRASHRGRQRGQ